jgi:nucleotide-binding universal stress UspA family protein
MSTQRTGHVSPHFEEEKFMLNVAEPREKPAAQLNKPISLSRILVATDFSPVSDRALDYAIAFARRYDAHICLTHIISPDPFQLAEPQLAQATYEKIRQEAQEGIADVLISGKLHGIPHGVLLYEGNVWPTIEKLMKQHDIDFVVAGTHGYGQVRKVLMGSVAEQIFRSAKVPVLTVGPAAKPKGKDEITLKRILFATDFGTGADKAAAYAFSLAQEHNANLTVLHVVDSGAACTEETIRRLREVNIVRMKQHMPADAEDWCTPEFRVTFGPVVEEILTAASESRADLIVMGAKARQSLASHAPLTVAYNVVSKASCPVLTVRG